MDFEELLAQKLKDLVGLARLGASGLWKYEAALNDAEELLRAREGKEKVIWPCGCEFEENKGFSICEECAESEAHKPPYPIKTPLELFDGSDMNIKSSAGISEYRFNRYSIRRIRNALGNPSGNPRRRELVGEKP